MSERTTDINKIKNGGGFTWGEVVKIHEIGEYSISEHHPWVKSGCTIETGNVSLEETEYHVWINGRDTSCGYNSLDAALAGAIAYKNDGSNSRAGLYFMRMIGIAE